MSFRTRKKAAAFSLLILYLCATLLGCAQSSASATVSTTAATLPTTTPTEPPATIAPDGNPADVTCQGSYTLDEGAASAAMDTVVATMGETTLTNSQLQVFYRMEVVAYREAGHETAPDFTKELDTQPCEIDASVNSWQQYFLRCALDRWAKAQALVLHSKQVPLVTEEAYQPNERVHNIYYVDMPTADLLYGNNEFYLPNKLHQEYLDNIPTLLEELAAALGYADAAALAADFSGTGPEDLISAAQLLNYGYMYYTEMGYDFAPTAEEVEAYFAGHEADYASTGITRDSGRYVDMRHILLVPNRSTIAEDGTVTASPAAWLDCQQTANELLQTYQTAITTITQYDPNPSTYGNFAELAVAHSDDPGSASRGGLYRNVTKGQLAAPLDAWLFDPSRQSDDVTILRSDAGLHLVFFEGSREIWYAAAEQDLLEALYDGLVAAALELNPPSIDYSAICLYPDRGYEALTADALLYPDIAHERFPVAPVYLQMDYPTTMYGNYPLRSHGCGITTMAMLSTYMSDTELTPPTLCARYGRYCVQMGTNREMFNVVPSELGFYLKFSTFVHEEAYEALKEGYPVACIQRKGYWTGGGHFLMLEKLNEDGTVQVRDSNIINYGKLPGHAIDAHEWKTIPPAAALYWIYEKKVTNCNQCIRCAGADADTAPELLFNGDYLCEKCSTALLRRNSYLG